MHSSKEHYNINMTLTLTITYSIYLIQLMLIDIEYLGCIHKYRENFLKTFILFQNI